MNADGGFDHNAQTLRIVTQLENALKPGMQVIEKKPGA